MEINKEDLLITYQVLEMLDKEVKPSLHNAVVSVKNEIANSLIVDGRNIYEIKDMMQWGFDYLSIGRTDKFYASSAKKI